MDINQVTAEINAILGAPVAFALTVGVSILVIWRVVNWGYARQVNALRENVIAKEAQLVFARAHEGEIARHVVRLQSEVGELKKQIDSNTKTELLVNTSTSVSRTINDLRAASLALSNALSLGRD